jgi:hypothetical protein
LELAQTPQPGVKIQCGTCGAQFGVRTAAKPTVIPTAVPTVTPVAISEAPADHFDPPGPVKKKKKKRFKKKSSSGFFGSSVGTFIIAVVILGAVVTVGAILLMQTGLFGGLSAVAFNDELVGIMSRLEKSGEQLERNSRSNPARAMQQVDIVRTAVAAALKDAKKITPPKDGEAFHGAVVMFLERLDRFFGAEIRDAINMASNGQQGEAMRMLMSAMTELEQLQTSYINAQQTFAKKHGLTLMQKPRAGPGFAQPREGPGWGAFGIE